MRVHELARDAKGEMGEASTAEKRTKCIWVQPEAVAPIEVLANNLAKG